MSKVVDVVMPEQHEGTKATVLRWCRKVGERVVENEPLVELETDKVTVEIPSPASGELIEIFKAPNDAVEPMTVLARVRLGAVAATTGKTASAPAQAADHTRGAAREDNMPLSPAVRKLLAEHGIDATSIPGTGRDGRLTAQDILRHVDQLTAARAGKATRSAPAAATTQASAGQKIPHSGIRRRIAEHMVQSMATAPHVTTLFEADLSRLLVHKAKHGAAFEQRGAKLTLTSYFVAASVRALQAVPEVNAT